MQRFLVAAVVVGGMAVAAVPAMAWAPRSVQEASAEKAAGFTKTAAVGSFDELSGRALLAMKKHAAELKTSGVALVAYFEGDTITAWSSKMVVVGRMKDPPTSTDKGNNLLAIAYAKAAEMADTLKDSGSKVRPPMTGEFGWEGGVIARGRTGYWIAAFSGGKSEDDVSVSRAGMAELQVVP